jgi:RHS repeat-associated protein
MQLSSNVQIPDGLLAANALLSEKSRLGFRSDDSTLRWGSRVVISSTAIGISGTLYDSRIESRYTGKERDVESGNDYFGARYYASTMGRFMSPDWSGKVEPVPYSKLDDPQSLNLYGYVLNNPLTGLDSDGHQCDVCTKFYNAVHDLITVKTKVGSGAEVSAAIGGVKVTASAGAGTETTYHPFSDSPTTSENKNESKLELKVGPLKGELTNPAPSLPDASGKVGTEAPGAGAKIATEKGGALISNTGDVTLLGASLGVGPIKVGAEINLDLGNLKTAAQTFGPAIVGGAKDILSGAFDLPWNQPTPILPQSH